LGGLERTHRRSDVVSTHSSAGHGALFWDTRWAERRALGRPAYLWTIFTNPAEQGYLLNEGWNAMLRVFILGLVMDAIYQFIVLRCFYPGEALITAFVLAFVPYLLIRGPVNRIARGWNRQTPASGRNL